MKISFNAFNNSFCQVNNSQAKKSRQVCPSLSKDLFVKNSNIAFKGKLFEVDNAQQLISRLKDNGKIEGKDYLTDLGEDSCSAYKHVVVLDGGIPRTIYDFDAKTLNLVIKESYKYPIASDLPEDLYEEDHTDIKDYQSAFDYVAQNACTMETICVKKDGGYFINTLDLLTQRILNTTEYGSDGTMVYSHRP